MKKIMEEYDAILEMTKRKITDIENGEGDGLDSGELDDLLDCVNILSKLAKIKCIAHELHRHGAADAMKTTL